MRFIFGPKELICPNHRRQNSNLFYKFCSQDIIFSKHYNFGSNVEHRFLFTECDRLNSYMQPGVRNFSVHGLILLLKNSHNIDAKQKYQQTFEEILLQEKKKPVKNLFSRILQQYLVVANLATNLFSDKITTNCGFLSGNYVMN